jgi:hypothetical protein
MFMSRSTLSRQPTVPDRANEARGVRTGPEGQTSLIDVGPSCRISRALADAGWYSTTRGSGVRSVVNTSIRSHS